MSFLKMIREKLSDRETDDEESDRLIYRISRWMRRFVGKLKTDEKLQKKFKVILSAIFTIYASSALSQIIMVAQGELAQVLLNPLYICYIFFTCLPKLYHLLFICCSIAGSAYFWITMKKIFYKNYVYDKERNIKVAKDGTYGNAHWMTEEEKEKAMIRSKDPRDIKLDILGYDNDGYLYARKKIRYTNGNEIIIGPPGSGKSTCKLNNDILQSIVRGESYVAVDSKGTVYRDTMYAAKKAGYVIKMFNLKPTEIKNSDAVDLFKIFNNYKMAKGIANSLATTIMMNINDERAKKDIWYTGALNLLKAAKLITKYDENIPEEERTFGTMYMTLVECSNWVELQARWGYVLDNPEHPAYEAWKTFSGYRDVIKESILGGLLTNLSFMADPMVREIVSRDEIDLTLPGRKKCAYYLIIDDQDKSNNVLASLFMECLSLQLKNFADSQDIPGQVEVALPVSVNLLIDEFKAVGKFPSFPEKLATYRSRGITIKFIIQDLSQIMEMYPGEQFRELIACCTTMVVLMVGEQATAEYIEKRLGTQTAIVENARDRRSKLRPVDFHIDYQSTEGMGSRALMTAAEIMGEGDYGLKPTEMLVIINGQAPLKLNKWFWLEHPLATALHLDDESRKFRSKDHMPKWRKEYDRMQEKKRETIDVEVSNNQMTMVQVNTKQMAAYGKASKKPASGMKQVSLKKNGGVYARQNSL